MPDNEYWQKRAEKNLLNTEKNSEKYINELINIYDNSLTEIDNEIKKIYNKYSSIDGTLKKEEIDKLLNSKESKEYYNELLRQIRKIKDEDMRKNLIAKYNAPAFNYRISRLEALKKDIAMKIKILANKELDITKNNYINTINNSYLSSKAIISDMKMINNISFQSINKNVLNRILNTNWLGSNFSKRIWKNSDLLEKSLNDILKTGITAGLSLPKMSTKLKEAMNTSLYNATRLIRTETNHFHNEAEYQSYLDDGVTEYEYLAVLDGRTSEVCRNLNGKIFNIKEKKTGVNYPPMHPFCRSTTLPVIDSIRENIDNTENNDIIKPNYLIKSYDPNVNLTKLKFETMNATAMMPEKVQKLMDKTTFIVGDPNKPSCYDRKNDIIYVNDSSNKYEIIHEIGHLVETKLGILNNQEYLELKKDITKNNKRDDIISEKYYAGKDSIYIYILKNTKFISEYQGFVYTEIIEDAFSDNQIKVELLGEYFSEGYREYFENPNNLKEKDIDLYNYIERCINNGY